MVRLFRLLATLSIVLLAACAAQPAAQPTLAPDPTLAPTDLPAATTSIQPTASMATAEPPAAATVAPAAEEASIQIGQTPEGYQYLGSPNAPVTITFYSDFF